MNKYSKIAANLTLLMTVFVIPDAFSMEPKKILFAFVGDTGTSAYTGSLQGLSEANLQGQFLNLNYTLEVIDQKNAITTDYSNYIAIVSAADKNTFNEIAINNPDTAVFNITLDNDELRQECLPNALHIVPSNQMKVDAVNQWRKKVPETTASAQAWHPDYVKFAARDLNKRYAKSHDTKMDDTAWAGWAAIKMSSDTVARENIAEAGKLLNYLKTELKFDGQKGIEMNFRETGQLGQPLLLVENDEIVAEAPVRGVAKPPSEDSLGVLNCPK